MAQPIQQESHFGAKIKVIGVGGAGTNAVSTMFHSNIEGVDFIAANTDLQSLKNCSAHKKIQIGKALTKGLGAGADPNIGRDAALEDRHEIVEALSGADMVFITAGMGGGTGTGGAAVVSQIAREHGALTVGVVTRPFTFEGKRRQRYSEMGIERLKDHVDTLIIIPNQRLLSLATPDLSMVDAFKLADNILVNAVKGISDIINVPGTINVDFADVKTVMSSTGQALMGIGIASGENRAIHAANQAISSPLLEDIDIDGATGILINITAGSNISLMEVSDACSIIQEAAHEDANIIFGAVIDESLGQEIRVTVIATGFTQDKADKKSSSKHYAGQPILQTFEPIHQKIPTMNTDLYESNRIQGASSEAPQKAPPHPPVHVHNHEEAAHLAEWTFTNTLENKTHFSQHFNPLENTLHAHDAHTPTSRMKDFREPMIDDNHLFFKTSESLITEIDKKIDEVLNSNHNLLKIKNNDFDAPSFLRVDPKDLTF